MRDIASVSHLTIATPDPVAAAGDYERLLGVPAIERAAGDGRSVRVFRTGNVALLLRASDDGEPEGLGGLTFRVGDLTRARETLSRCGVPVGAGDEAMLDGAATHGVPLAVSAGPVPGDGASSPVTLDHVVIRTPNPDRAVALYGGRLGLDMRLDRSNPAWNARLMFFRCGDLVVEIAHVLSDGVSCAPDTFGGLSWRVPDIDAMHDRLTRDGFDLSPVRTGRRPGSRVCTVRNRMAGVPTILLGLTERPT